MRPFRWTIAKREQLGSLVSTDADGLPDLDAFVTDLRQAAARIVAFADNSDLVFVGRTPENFFDYLSGVFHDVGETPRLHLLQFSLRWAGAAGVRAIEDKKLTGFFRYLEREGLDPASISSGERPVAFVDYVAEGGTFRNLISLLQMHAERSGTDWNAVQRRLRIIGLRIRTHNSPKTRRWQQHQDWLGEVPDMVIKNVSVPARLLYHIANDQPKVTRAFHPDLWDRANERDRNFSPAQLGALAFAVQLFDRGREREERLQLARLISGAPEMRQATTRRIVSRLKGL